MPSVRSCSAQARARSFIRVIISSRTDGFSGARIEEEVIVTDTGYKLITHFPAEELPIANRY